MWSAVRARITGESHVRKALPCQDFAENQITSNCMVCVVADGASTAPLGEVGASIAVESIMYYFRNTSMEAIRAKDLEKVSQEIQKNYFQFLDSKKSVLCFPTQPSDYAATVGFIAVWESQNYFLCGVVGDCIIGLFGVDGKTEELFGVQSINDNQRTPFITEADVSFQFIQDELSKYRGFILSTDGCAKGGVISLDNHFDMCVEQAIFNALPYTQNPEVWLTRFIEKNISVHTSDDLSMYVIYPETENRSVQTGICAAEETDLAHGQNTRTSKKNAQISIRVRLPDKWSFHVRLKNMIAKARKFDANAMP